MPYKDHYSWKSNFVRMRPFFINLTALLDIFEMDTYYTPVLSLISVIYDMKY